MQKKLKSAIVAGTAVALVGGGAAVAFWTSTGSGTGAGSTGSSTAFTVDVANVTTNTLSPGGPSQTVSFTVTNPSTGHQNVSGASAVVPASWSSGTCNASDFDIANVTVATGDLAPGAVANGSLVLSMINKASNQNDCQGVSVPVTVSIS